MRLLEAILARPPHSTAPLELAPFATSLPLVALTCIDVRLNPLLPDVLGLPPEQFVWLRNAGNIVTGNLSSTLRSLALACAVKGGREIIILGHSDCKVSHTSVSAMIDRFKELGVDRRQLPDNLVEFFGLFASERANVIRAAGYVRASPLIGAAVPVHGLLLDLGSGRLEWLVNGYEQRVTGQLEATALPAPPELGEVAAVSAPVAAPAPGASGASTVWKSHHLDPPQSAAPAAPTPPVAPAARPPRLHLPDNELKRWLKDLRTRS